MTNRNSDNGTLYITGQWGYLGGYQGILLYKDSGRTQFVAAGVSRDGDPQTILLSEENSSGLSGTVDWSGNAFGGSDGYIRC